MPNIVKEIAAINALDASGLHGAAFYVRKAIAERDMLLSSLRAIISEYEAVDYLEMMDTDPLEKAIGLLESMGD